MFYRDHLTMPLILVSGKVSSLLSKSVSLNG